MQVEVMARKLKLGADRREWILQRARFALGRFGDRIRIARIHLQDVNGPRGGWDARCLVEVGLRRSGQLVVEAIDQNMEVAAATALDRMARRVREEFSRRRDSRGGLSASGA